MANYNKVMLMGNLTRDPELRHIPSGTAVASITIAVNERYKDKQDQWVERANFIDCEAWGRTAEVMCEYLQKGRPVFIEGRLRLDQWQDQEGNNRSKLKVVIDGFQFIDSKGGGDGGSSQRSSSQSSTPVPTGANHDPIDEDDIPF